MKRTAALLATACIFIGAHAGIESPLAMNAAVTTDAPMAQVAENQKDTSDYGALSFAWGADAGASIDLTGNDMSAFDFDVSLGIRRGWINFLGVSVGADISISNSTRAYPLLLHFRTNFNNRPTLVFWDVRGGMAYNMLEHNHQQWGAYASTGIGFNLARSSKFVSYLTLGYTFRQRKKVVGTEMTHDFTDLHMVTVRLGVTF